MRPRLGGCSRLRPDIAPGAKPERRRTCLREILALRLVFEIRFPQRALRRPLEAAGVEFIDENGSGVKLRAKKGCAMPCKGCLKNKHRLPFENVRSGQRQADTQPMCAAFRYGRPRSPIRTTRCGGAN
jgi:hypothetical protein